MIAPELFIEIEEILNQKVKNVASQCERTYKYDAKLMEQISEHLKESADFEPVKPKPLYEVIVKYIEHLNNDKYMRNTGGIKEATFYQEAKIDKSTWSGIKCDQITPSKKTLLKLIIALKLSHEEAEQLLSRYKEQFDPNEIQDQVIEAIIMFRNNYDLTVQDVQDILYEYQTMYASTKPFDSIYETPEMIAERKGAKKRK